MLILIRYILYPQDKLCRAAKAYANGYHIVKISRGWFILVSKEMGWVSTQLFKVCKTYICVIRLPNLFFEILLVFVQLHSQLTYVNSCEKLFK